jgi:LysM repeat protein
MHMRRSLPDIRWFISVSAALLFLSGCAGIPSRPPQQGFVPPCAVYHTVEKGQTLWRIARIYGIDLRSLMAANHISDPSRIETGRQLLIPQVAAVAGVPSRAPAEMSIDALVGCPLGRVRWRTITIHHSATRYGNARVFDRYHRKKGMQGLFYHFLIGNGNGLGDGQIEVGWRWKEQAEVNRPQDIQICLVGNLMKQPITERQYETLKRLIAVLRRRYGIAAPGSIRRHCDVVSKPTECPGVNFPYGRLLRDLRNGN